MDEKRKKKQIAKISVFITSIFVIVLSLTYAFINMTVTGTKRQVITSGNLQVELEEDNAITLTNAMPTYDEVGMIQPSFNFRLVNKTSEDTNYIVRLVDITDASKQKLDTSIVKYGLTKDGVSTTNLLSTLKDNQIDSGKISGNQTIHYSLRLWINSEVTDNASIKDKTLTYRIDVEASQDTGVTKSIVFDTAVANLGENCSTYNDGTDTFLVGQCSKNYVWYSGKLWRVVLKNNETGDIKMVTDNNMTTITDDKRGNFVGEWLEQEFLLTLHDIEKFLVVDSVWYTSSADSGLTRPDGSKKTTTVGLLNSYEYQVTFEKSNGLATSSTGYLNNETNWWLGTFNISGRSAVFGDNVIQGTTSAGCGVRPSVSLRSNVNIISGEGTLSNPYRLEGDSQETINGTTLLSTRYSGEYVNFNNALYRIVGEENGLTKITAVKAIQNMSYFNSSDSGSDFGNSVIKNDLETYYQGLDAVVKNMIKTNATWYLGSVSESYGNYKSSICLDSSTKADTKTCTKVYDTTTANIGLPRYGEMFTAKIRGGVASFWTLTPAGTSKVWVSNQPIELTFNPRNPTRPSMYLKSNIRIASSNTGDGTYEKPYDIELGQS